MDAGDTQGKGTRTAITYGYARCSTCEQKQDIQRQVRQLQEHGAKQVYLEYEHGDAAVKGQLEALLAAAQPGDTLMMLEVSRLSRSTRQLCDLLETVRAKRLRLAIVGSVTVDCRGGQLDPMSQAFLQMAGVFAELEMSMTRARIKSGLENARQKGKRLGRPPLTADAISPLFYCHYPAYKSGALS